MTPASTVSSDYMDHQLPNSHQRILSIGSAVVDMFIHSDSWTITTQGGRDVLSQTFGDKVEMDSLHVVSGGGATNTAVAFQRLGFQASVVAELGKDNLNTIIISELEAADVDTSLLIQERREQTGGSVILVGPTGERIAMVHRGAAGMLDTNDIPWSSLADFSWVHLTSLGDRYRVITELDKRLADHQGRWSWNPGSAELHALAKGELSLPQPDILFVNNDEWEIISSLHAQLKTKIPIIVITKGRAGGSVLVPGTPAQSFTAAAVESIDDTGAGDAFGAAFVAAHVRGESPVTAARWGVLNAASVVQQIGAKAGLLSLHDLVRHQRWYDE